MPETESSFLIDNAIKKLEYMTHCTGLHVRVKKKTKKDKYLSWFFYIVNIIWLSTDVGGAMIWFCIGVAQNRSILELVYAAPCIVICWIGMTKGFFTFISESEVDFLIEEIRQLETQQRNRVGDSETEEIIKEEHMFLNRVLRLLNFFYIFLMICFALNPLMLVLLHYVMTNKVILLLPFINIYPFDPLDMRYYPWVYLRQIGSEVLVIHSICIADFSFYIFCTYLRTQFHLLQHYIERVIPSQSKNEIVCEIQIKLQLRELVKWHHQLISTAQLLEMLYTRSTLFNFVMSSILICLTGFNIVTIFENDETESYDKIALFCIFLSFLLSSLLQIFFLCFFGDRLMQSSMEVKDAVYKSTWYLADISVRKSLFLVQTRAEKPCKLTAWDFSDVNLNAFMTICSTAWSYFALLQTMYSTE